jgi:hypothetical protein
MTVKPWMCAIALFGLVSACDKSHDASGSDASVAADGSASTTDGATSNTDSAVATDDGGVPHRDGATSVIDAAPDAPPGPAMLALEDFPAAFAAVVCDHLECIAAGEQAVALPLIAPDDSRETCLARSAALFGPLLIGDKADKIEDGILAYDPIAAHACVTALAESAECDYFGEGFDLCDDFSVFEGRLILTAECDSDSDINECASGMGCRRDGFSPNACPAHCVDTVAPGEACSDGTFCDPGRASGDATCRYNEADEGTVCYQIVDADERAAIGDECGWAAPTADDDYILENIDCVDGAYCDGSRCVEESGGGDDTVLEVVTTVGAACGFIDGTFFMCDPLASGAPLICVEGDGDATCQRVGDGSDGAACTPFEIVVGGDNCAEGFYCSGSDDFGAPAGVCKPLRAIDDSCGSDDSCATGYCEPSSSGPGSTCEEPVCAT